MATNPTGPELAAIRLALGVTATALGRQMGYSGNQPHSRVFQIEALASVSQRMADRYLEAIAALRRAAEEKA